MPTQYHYSTILCMYIYMYEYCILIQRKRKAKTVTGISKRRKRNTEEKHQVLLKTPNRRPRLVIMHTCTLQKQ